MFSSLKYFPVQMFICAADVQLVLFLAAVLQTGGESKTRSELMTGRSSLLETILSQSGEYPTPQSVKMALFSDSPDSGTGSPFSRMLETRTPVPIREVGRTCSLDTPVRDENEPPFTTPGELSSFQSPLIEPSESEMANGGLSRILFGDQPGEGSPTSGPTHLPPFTLSANTRDSGQISFSPDDTELGVKRPEQHEPKTTNGRLSHTLFGGEPDKGGATSGHTHVSPSTLSSGKKDSGQISFSPDDAELNRSVRSILVEEEFDRDSSSWTVTTEEETSIIVCEEDDNTRPLVAPEETTETATVCGVSDLTLPPSSQELRTTTSPDKNQVAITPDLLKRLEKLKQAQQSVQIVSTSNTHD